MLCLASVACRTEYVSVAARRVPQVREANLDLFTPYTGKSQRN